LQLLESGRLEDLCAFLATVEGALAVTYYHHRVAPEVARRATARRARASGLKKHAGAKAEVLVAFHAAVRDGTFKSVYKTRERFAERQIAERGLKGKGGKPLTVRTITEEWLPRKSRKNRSIREK
jgi:hypothetical protein